MESVINDGSRKYHPRARKIVEYLVKNRRVTSDELTELENVGSDREWLTLAERSHNKTPLDLIVTRRSESHLPRKGWVADVVSLEDSDWHQRRKQPAIVEASLEGYFRALAQIAKHSVRLEFIDPFLKPWQSNYSHFPKLLAKLAAVNPDLFFEVHLSEQVERREKGEIVAREAIRPFIAELRDSEWRGELDLHVWDYIHDRYILSNLIGISVQRGPEIRRRPVREPLIWKSLRQSEIEVIKHTYDPRIQLRNHRDQFTYGGSR